MKLTLAQIQLLEILINMIRYNRSEIQYKIVANINNQLISFKCFNEYTDITPVVYLDDIALNKNYLPAESKLWQYAIEFYNTIPYNHIKLSHLYTCPEMLLQYLFTIITKYDDLETAYNFIYDIDFILQDKHFDFYYLDTSSKYEVVSLIQVW